MRKRWKRPRVCQLRTCQLSFNFLSNLSSNVISFYVLYFLFCFQQILLTRKRTLRATNSFLNIFMWNECVNSINITWGIIMLHYWKIEFAGNSIQFPRDISSTLKECRIAFTAYWPYTVQQIFTVLKFWDLISKASFKTFLPFKMFLNYR